MQPTPDKVIPEEKPILPLRQEVGLIVHRVIPAKGWQKVFHELAVQGVVDDKMRDKLLILLCQRVEKLEHDMQKLHE